MPGNRGYKYFGAARDLPGVRELFDTDVAPSGKKTRAELMKENHQKLNLINQKNLNFFFISTK